MEKITPHFYAHLRKTRYINTRTLNTFYDFPTNRPQSVIIQIQENNNFTMARTFVWRIYILYIYLKRHMPKNVHYRINLSEKGHFKLIIRKWAKLIYMTGHNN